MKRALLFVSFFITSALLTPICAQGLWEKTTDYPTLNGLYGQSVNVVNGLAYLAFGIDKNDVISSDIFEFAPNGAVWTKKKQFPGTPRYGSASFAIGDTIYYLDGSTGPGTPHLYEFWAYSVQGDTWSPKLNRLATGRTCATAFSINGEGYIYGGTQDTTTYFNDIWQFSPAYGTWSSSHSIPLPYGRIGASAFVLNGKAYICGGKTIENIYLDDTWEFEPLQWKWVQKASRPSGLGTAFGTAFSLDRASTSKGYYGLGSSLLQLTNDFPVSIYEYDLNTDTWELINDFPVSGRSNTISFVSANTAYIGAGASDTELHTYERDIWSLSMPGNNTVIPSISGRIHQDSLFLINGKVIAYNLTTKRKYAITTNKAGEFAFNSLPEGEYVLKAIPNTGEKYDPTFYPNKVDSLKTVTLILGNSISEIDLFMHSTKTDTKQGESTFDSFDVYPNPFEKSINVVSLNTSTVFKEIQISNLMGEVQKEIEFNQDISSYGINMENMNSGVYILKVESNLGIYLKKLLKNNICIPPI